MKNIKYILLLTIGLLFTACEEVVDVDLDTAPPRLVVDANIDWIKGTDGSQQTIRLTTTGGYYENTVPPVSGAIVTVTDNNTNTVFEFIEEAGTGFYKCTNFIPVLGDSYTLTVLHEGQTYTATDTLYTTPDITRIVQNNEGGFLNEDVEVRLFFMDNGNEDNYYLTRYDTSVLPYPDYDVLDDEFFQGNEMFNFISDEDFKPGDVIHIKLHGISERYYNYMSILTELAGGGAGSGPFQTPPVNVRGNLINQTNQKNFALGYFRLGEVTAVDYTIE